MSSNQKSRIVRNPSENSPDEFESQQAKKRLDKSSGSGTLNVDQVVSMFATKSHALKEYLKLREAGRIEDPEATEEILRDMGHVIEGETKPTE